MAKDIFGVLRPGIEAPQKTVVVLGAPRGGTSMVAATVRKLGIMMGENLGHQHEDRCFRRDVPIREMIRTVKERNAAHDAWGWKLPNNVYYVEKLLPHLRNPHFVAVFRNPYSVARSSAERDDRVYDNRLLQVAVNHTKKVIDLIQRLRAPTAMASFESAIDAPEDFVRGLADFLGVKDEATIANAFEGGVNQALGYIKF